jgi:DNA-binding SARP family transcriptional activator
MDSLAQADDPNLRLSLIRGFELRSGSFAVPMAFSAQRLMAFVALQDGVVRRSHASGMLWANVTEQRASSSLRSALWRTPSPGGRSLIQASSTHLRLSPAVKVDFRETVSLAVSVLDHEDGLGGTDDLRDQLRQLGHDLLPDWYEDWVLVERERYRQLRLHALEAVCHRLTDLGRYALALDAGLAAVACEPLRESAQREVIRVHLAEGNTAEALRQYRSYAHLLSKELGARPSPSLQRLLSEASSGDVAGRISDAEVTGEGVEVSHGRAGVRVVNPDPEGVAHRGRTPASAADRAR